jgi:hypothetical protein
MDKQGHWDLDLDLLLSAKQILASGISMDFLMVEVALRVRLSGLISVLEIRLLGCTLLSERYVTLFSIISPSANMWTDVCVIVGVGVAAKAEEEITRVEEGRCDCGREHCGEVCGSYLSPI